MRFFRCKHHHTKFTKNSTKTRKPIRLGYRRIYVVPSPVPHTKLTKINEMHGKGAGAEGRRLFFFYLGMRGGDCGLPRRGGLSRASPGAKRKGLATRRGARRGGAILFADEPICFQVVHSRIAPPFFWRVGRGTRTTSAEADRSVRAVLAEQISDLRPSR